MLYTPFYDPKKSYEKNYSEGPFGAFANGKSLRQKGEPTHDYHGHKVYLPFGIPPGPLVNGRFVAAAFRKGFDICAYKTVRSDSYPCHPYPNVLYVDVEGDLTPKKAHNPVRAHIDYREPLTITNSFGVPSKSSKVWKEDVREAVASAGKGQVCIVSFMGTVKDGQSKQEFVDDHKRVCQLVLETDAPILEVNLSCPNVGNEGLICYDLGMTESIMHELKKLVGQTPLLMKIGYFESDEDLAKVAAIAHETAHGICAINTLQAPVVDREGNQALPGKNRLKSGICGSAITWAGLDMTGRLNNIKKEKNYSFSIESMGGVMSAEDYSAYKDAGADVVMSATGAMWNPYLASEIKESSYTSEV